MEGTGEYAPLTLDCSGCAAQIDAGKYSRGTTLVALHRGNQVMEMQSMPRRFFVSNDQLAALIICIFVENTFASVVYNVGSCRGD